MAKSNDAEATLRKSSLPKAEAVREAKDEKGACKRAAKKQWTGNVGNISAEHYDADPQN